MLVNHDYVIKWKHFPRNWPFVRGIEFPAQKSVTRSFYVFFDLRLNKRLSKHSWVWWFETLSRPLWRHSNDYWQSISGVRLMTQVALAAILGANILVPCQVVNLATHMKIGRPQMKSTDALILNEFQWPHLKIGHRDNIHINGRCGGTPCWRHAVCNNINYMS